MRAGLIVRVGVLHPGAMGASVAAALRDGGSDVAWASEGRSAASAARAAAEGLTDDGDVRTLARRADAIVSVCPPHAALDVAGLVAGLGFGGLYLDANAVSPSTARAIASTVVAGGATFADGGIVGPPARSPGSTRLYLSGDGARVAASLFEGSMLEAIAIDGRTESASALKMCYAAWTKGSAALLAAVRALAGAEGVSSELEAEWDRSIPGLRARAEASARGPAAKAWRFVGEMHQIAATFREAGLPDGFHEGAAEVYRRLEGFKDAPEPPPLDDVLAALLARDAQSAGTSGASPL